MPIVPPPEECELEEDRYALLGAAEGTHPKLKQLFEAFVAVRVLCSFA